FDSEWIARKLEKAAFGNPFARAAIEMALLDLQGQILGVPLYKILGGRDRPPVAADPGVRLQFVLGSDRGLRLKFVIGAGEPHVSGEGARGLVARGWRAITVKVGRDARADADRLKAVRDNVGPDLFLSVDANGGYSVEQAIWAGRGFAPPGIAPFEQPHAPGGPPATAPGRAPGQSPRTS